MGATSAVIPASGLGKRLNSGTGKALFELDGKPLLAHTLTAFQKAPVVDEIVIVALEEQIENIGNLVLESGFSKVTTITPGGEFRQDSVLNGLRKISSDAEIVAIHDGARPFITENIIASSVEAAGEDGAAIAAVPVIDTIKSSSDKRYVSSTLDRQKLFSVQTPQTFDRKLIESAYANAYEDDFYGTDDASLVERLGLPVRIVEGSYENIKVTTPADIVIAEAILSRRKPQSSEYPLGISKSLGSAPFRIGHGYDIHRFAPDRKLFLGGMELPGEAGLLGHSDADVLLHAISDAILGAAGAGDIGRLFPDTDPTYKDIRSTILLKRVGEVADDLGWRVVNIDATVIAEQPKISPHASQMASNIAEALGILSCQVSVKGSTAEKLGPIGEGLGIECHAVVLLAKI